MSIVIRPYGYCDCVNEVGLWDESLHAWAATPDHDDVSEVVQLFATGDKPARYAIVLAAGKDHVLVKPSGENEPEVWHRSNMTWRAVTL